MRKIILFLSILIALFSKECSDQYDPEGFLDSPMRFGEIVEESLNGLPLFGNEKEYKKLGFGVVKTIDGIYFLKKGCYVKNRDNIYPICNGIWRYHVDKDGFVDEFDIAEAFKYQDALLSVASEINSDFEGLWSGWDGDAYGHYLSPEDAQLRYGDHYLSLNVFLYGVKEDATGLKNTVINYRILNYTNEVLGYIKCKGKK